MACDQVRQPSQYSQPASVIWAYPRGWPSQSVGRPLASKYPPLQDFRGSVVAGGFSMARFAALAPLP